MPVKSSARCNCTLTQNLLGDGCDICQPKNEHGEVLNKYIVSFEKYTVRGILRCFTYTIDCESIDDALGHVLHYRGTKRADIIAPNIDSALNAIGYPEPMRHLTKEDYS